jgi:hypothetical protein
MEIFALEDVIFWLFRRRGWPLSALNATQPLR